MKRATIVLRKIYFKLPKMFRSILSRLIYKPKISKTATLLGWSIFSKNVSIGDYTLMNENQFISNIEIGKFCSIASNFCAGLGEHSVEGFSTFCFTGGVLSPFSEKDFHVSKATAPRFSKKIMVMNDVWIGANVTIKGGVTVGNGAVIGSNALVTKDVPPYAIVGGVPARIIRYRFDQEKINFLQKSQWWDWPVEKLRKNAHMLEDFQSI